MRGEYLTRSTRTPFASELPPRARRIPWGLDVAVSQYGTTSACAENTWLKIMAWAPIWNYLRVRGEYPIVAAPPASAVELPPRARRILAACVAVNIACGTTSACAENTSRPSTAPAESWNYLRVRGEYNPVAEAGVTIAELPPRARRIRHHHSGRAHTGGTTSACAENTPVVVMMAGNPGNYLRVRGEYPK